MKDTPFQRHGRFFEDYKYCYPVISRRSYGLSLGINLSRRKECNFDCPYCQVDRTVETDESKEIDLDILKNELLSLITDALSGELFNHERFTGADEYYKILRDIALSGDGEPTTSKYFLEIAEIVMRIIREYRDKEILIKPVVITNGTMLHKKEVSDILKEMIQLEGGPWVKLDASNPDEFKLVAQSRIPYENIIDNIINFGRENKIVIQMNFYYNQEGSESFSIESMVSRLNDFKNKGVLIDYIQLYTLARSTKIPTLKAIPKNRMEEVAEIFRKQTGFKIGVYP